MATILPPWILISTLPELRHFLASLSPLRTLYVDVRGSIHGRQEVISAIAIVDRPGEPVRLIDVLTLGDRAFTTQSFDGKSLKYVLESPVFSKCFWDVVNDAYQLWTLFGVGLSGVTDLQLLELVSRSRDRTKLVAGLDLVVQLDLNLDADELEQWMHVNDSVRKHMRFDIFVPRPLNATVAQFCANEVLHLPALHATYLERITDDWLAEMKDESARRVARVRESWYDPRSVAESSAVQALEGREQGLTKDQIAESSTAGRGEGKERAGSERDGLDELLDALEDERMDDEQREMLGEDELSKVLYDWWEEQCIAEQEEMLGDDEPSKVMERAHHGRMDDEQRHLLNREDDAGFYDDDGTNAADGAFDEDAFDECWDKH